jgi:hypothetical protein
MVREFLWVSKDWISEVLGICCGSMLQLAVPSSARAGFAAGLGCSSCFGTCGRLLRRTCGFRCSCWKGRAFLVEVEADAAVRQALCGGLLRRASVAAAAGGKHDRLEWQGRPRRRPGPCRAACPTVGANSPALGSQGCSGLRPVAGQRTADGRVIARREGLLACWEGFFSAEFSGHTRTVEYEQAWEEVAKIIQDFTLTDAGL